MTEPDPSAASAEVMGYHQAQDLPGVRAFAQRRSERLGLAPDQVMSLTIAVSELVTNTLQHTSGGGRVWIRAEDGYVVCDVIDGGPMRAFGRPMPTPEARRGRGLAIVERLCDQVDAIAAAEGTIVRMRFGIAPRGS
ncbi:ATP-binding protein [Actinoplanes subglobosus]|uniref:ATP-binding protein n=1 Tax=Actinoplanes subglobosus TaxID=1547892 RepID=A0ABV8J0C6_9ACTN